MWARVSTYQFSSENLDQALDQINDALGSLDEPGLHRAELLVDRMSGKGMTITLWESEESLQASAQAANLLRNDTAHTAGASILDVEHYELVRV